MGQKVNPHGLRVGVIKDWDSKWYAEADFADLLVEDYNIRTYLKKKLYTMKTEVILSALEAKHPGEKEYLQAVKEVLLSIEEVYNQQPEFEKAKII